MISFPTTLNTGGAHISLPSAAPRGIGGMLENMGKTFVNSVTNRVLGGVLAFVQGNNASGGSMGDLSMLPYDEERADNLVLGRPEAGIRPSNVTLSQLKTNNTNFWYENSFVIDPTIYSMMNTYKYVYSGKSFVPLDMEQTGTKPENTQYGYMEWPGGSLSPSLFNPYYGIQRIGATKNTPLRDTEIKPSGKASFATDFTDCSIRTLCALSNTDDSELGAAKYKYADFMYCKDLGLPNNRMLTLRRFAMPVGDVIFGKAATSNGTYETPGDVGRLVGYFDTEDNKLEDILNYTFHATWEERTADWQQMESKEDNKVSPLGALLNTMSTSYREEYNKSIAGGNNILDWFLGGSTQWYSPSKVPYEWNYDKNKVYDPIDTVRKTHLYTGALEFNHEFTLTFNYTLRAYDDINPKSAMLDLLANATAVCYKRGHFWGGRQQIVGAQPNIAGWRKADKIINGAFDELGGVFQSLNNGGTDMRGFMGNLANWVGQAAEGIKNTAQDALDGKYNDNAKKALQQVKDAGSTVLGNMFGMLKGRAKNFLGRPQMYMFNSLLTGDNVGLWHLTIGNPRNPIAVMGNLIVTDARIQQYGPLGQDDFPTGLKVTVTLKHARPRDMVDIQKMYTRGIMAIYQNIIYPNSQTKGKTAKLTSHLGENGLPPMYWGESNQQKFKRNVDEIS